MHIGGSWCLALLAFVAGSVWSGCGSSGLNSPDDGSSASGGSGGNTQIGDDARPVADGTDAGPAALGGPCDVLTDAGPSQGVFNAEALECPSRICLKPVALPGSAYAATGAFCSASCEVDSDCAGQLGDPLSASDQRCKTGFVCGIPFVKGRLCCKKLCLCGDFLGTAGTEMPHGCEGDAGENCSSVSQ